MKWFKKISKWIWYYQLGGKAKLLAAYNDQSDFRFHISRIFLISMFQDPFYLLEPSEILESGYTAKIRFLAEPEYFIGPYYHEDRKGHHIYSDDYDQALRYCLYEFDRRVYSKI